MKVDYICTQWPLGPDKGPSAASRPASCVFLISYCFSQREGHLLIDCLNPLRINTAGSLCDAYPSSPHLSVCLQQARGGRERETPSNQPSLPNTGIVLASAFISLSLCSLWVFLITEKQNGLGNPLWTILTHRCIDALYELWNESGLPDPHSPSPVAFFNTFFIILTAGGSLGIDKWWNAVRVKAPLRVWSCLVDNQYLCNRHNTISQIWTDK